MRRRRPFDGEPPGTVLVLGALDRNRGALKHPDLTRAVALDVAVKRQRGGGAEENRTVVPCHEIRGEIAAAESAVVNDLEHTVRDDERSREGEVAGGLEERVRRKRVVDRLVGNADNEIADGLAVAIARVVIPVIAKGGGRIASVGVSRLLVCNLSVDVAAHLHELHLDAVTAGTVRPNLKLGGKCRAVVGIVENSSIRGGRAIAGKGQCLASVAKDARHRASNVLHVRERNAGEEKLRF